MRVKIQWDGMDRHGIQVTDADTGEKIRCRRATIVLDAEGDHLVTLELLGNKQLVLDLELPMKDGLVVPG